MIKVKQKISGCFRTLVGAQVFARIRGYLSTCRKQGHNLWEACRRLVLGQPFLDLRRDAVAGLEHPFIEPHLHPVRPQPLRKRAHHRLVLRAVAEENVVGESVGYGRGSERVFGDAGCPSFLAQLVIQSRELEAVAGGQSHEMSVRHILVAGKCRQ